MNGRDALAALLARSGPWCAADEAASRAPAHVTWSQEAAAHALLDIAQRWYGALLLDPVGAGKTHTALRWAELMGGALTVFAPAPLVPMWRDRAPSTVTVFSHAALSRRPIEVKTPLVVVDEAHHLRNPQTRRWMHAASACVGRRVLLLTATPVHNRLDDAMALLRLFAADEVIAALGSAYEALAALSVCRRREITHRPRRARCLRAPEPPPDVAAALDAAAVALAGAEDPSALLALLLRRRFSSSPAAARTTLRRAAYLLERQLDAASSGAVLDRAGFRALFGADSDAGAPQAVFSFVYGGNGVADKARVAELSARRRAVEAAHAAATDDRGALALVVDAVLEHGGHALVFTEFVATARGLFELLARRRVTVLLTGDDARASRVGAVARDVAIDLFRAGHTLLGPGPRVLVTTRIASEGLDLPEATLLVHADLPWTEATMAQRRGRLDRPMARETYDEVAVLPPRSVERAWGMAQRVSRKGAEGVRLLALLTWLASERARGAALDVPSVMVVEGVGVSCVLVACGAGLPLALVRGGAGWERVDALGALGRLHLRGAGLVARSPSRSEVAEACDAWEAGCACLRGVRGACSSRSSAAVCAAARAWEAGALGEALAVLSWVVPALSVSATSAARVRLGHFAGDDDACVAAHRRLGWVPREGPVAFAALVLR